MTSDITVHGLWNGVFVFLALSFLMRSLFLEPGKNIELGWTHFSCCVLSTGAYV